MLLLYPISIIVEMVPKWSGKKDVRPVRMCGIDGKKPFFSKTKKLKEKP
jgi:hypothetical protein